MEVDSSRPTADAASLVTDVGGDDAATGNAAAAADVKEECDSTVAEDMRTDKQTG